MSTSLILDSDAVKFSDIVFKLVIVCSNLFWLAPSLALAVETFSIALSIEVIADFAPLFESTVNVPIPRAVELALKLFKLSAKESLVVPGPICSVRLAELFNKFRPLNVVDLAI